MQQIPVPQGIDYDFAAAIKVVLVDQPVPVLRDPDRSLNCYMLRRIRDS